MDPFVQRTSQRVGSSQASSSKAPYQPYHSAASKQLARAQAATPSSSTPSSREGSPGSPSPAALSHEFPGDDANVGVVFAIDWEQIWRNGKKLIASRLGYRVKHLSQLRGGRQVSGIWKYGADLVYREVDGSEVKIWLCRACHLQKDRSAAKTYNGTRHIVDHLLKHHRIRLDGSLLGDLPHPPASPWEVAAEVAGANRGLATTEELVAQWGR